MKSIKIGTIFVGSIIALAGIGAGYAAWLDMITISGTVSLGSVSWEVTDYSGTWVYKDLITEECIESDVPLTDQDLLLVAHAEAVPGNGDCDVYVIFDNLFPCIWFKAGIVIKYTGTIPGKINDIVYSYMSDNNWIEPLIADGDIYATVRDTDGNAVELGYQLHENDEIKVELWIHIPQRQDLMNVSGSFTATFEVTQWNECITPIDDTNDLSLDISNYVIYQTSSSRSYTIPQGTITNPGDYVIIARDSLKDDFEGYWNISLSSNTVFLNSNNKFPSINGDETYELRDNSDTIVDGPTGQLMISGHTVERIHTTDNPMLPDSWNINPDSYATPGCGANGNGMEGLIINEYSDASGSGNWKYEFVELYYDAGSDS